MQTFLLYMIKSSTILIVLLTYYQFFLKRQTFFNLNRIFLLGVLILSALLPFISIEINRNDMIGFPTLASVSELLEENQIGKSSQSTLITATEQPIPMIPLLYGIGVVFFFPSLFNHSMPAMLIRSSKSTQTITWIVYDPNSGRPTYFLLL